MPDEREREGTPRVIGALDGTSVVAGAMVGVGILLVPRLVAGETESVAVYLGVWLVGGALSLAGAFVYAELGTLLPRAGGEYAYLSRAFGPATAFAAGWVLLAGIFAASIASIAAGLVRYQAPALLGIDADATLLPGVTTGGALACVVILALTALNAAGVKPSARAQTALTVVPVTLLVALALYAFATAPHATALAPAAPAEGGGLVAALLQVFFAYAGWNAVAYVGGEVKDPARTLPRALIGGTALVTALYLLLAGAFVLVLGLGGLRGAPEAGSATVRTLFGDEAGTGMAALIVVALLGTINATVLGGARIAFAVAEDGVLPASLGRLSARTHVPSRALWLQSVFACVLVLTGTFEELVELTTVTMLLVGSLTVVAAAVLRRKEPDLPRPYRATGWPLTPALFLLANAAVMVGVIARSLEDGELMPLVGAGVFGALVIGRRALGP